MKTYFSTFITGFDKVVEQALKKTLKDVSIEMLADGLVIYKTNAFPEEIKKIRFFNNSFSLLTQLENIDSNLPNPFIKQVMRDPTLDKMISPHLTKKITFRVIVSKENELIKIHSEIMKKLEDRLSQIKDLSLNRANPEVELWFILRREGLGLFGLRLTKHGNYEKTLQKGELRPELANILCLLSEPQTDDIFLDPLSGSGSIPIERAKSFSYKQILTGDIDPTIVNNLRTKTSKLNKNITVGRWDATNLKTFRENSVDKIVTDPPWGLHSGIHLNLPVFYSNIFNEFQRVLKPGGMLVILVAKKELLENVLKYHKNFRLLEVYTTLVNGQKAAVYKIKKNE